MFWIFTIRNFLKYFEKIYFIIVGNSKEKSATSKSAILEGRLTLYIFVMLPVVQSLSHV